jgi:hypothetical protein
LITIGIMKKRFFLLILGVAGQIFLFSTAADKIFLLSIVFIPLIILCLQSKKNNFSLRFLVGMSVLMAITIVFKFYPSDFGLIFQVLIGFRFISNNGFLTAVYSDFFSQNQWIYWSNLKGFSYFIHYPYPLTLAFLIGEYLGSDINNANANAWATDGIAACGLIGVLIVGLLIAFIFYLIDSAADGLDPKFSGATLAVQGTAISNTSIISTCLGGGLFFQILLLQLMPRNLFSAKRAKTQSESVINDRDLLLESTSGCEGKNSFDNKDPFP